MTQRNTFYVPIERRSLPACDPKRWMILPVEAPGPVCAITAGQRIAKVILPAERVTTWAAVRDIPSFASMQVLRDGLDASKSAPRARRTALAEVPAHG